MNALRVGWSGCSNAAAGVVRQMRRHSWCDVIAAHDADPAALAAFRSATGAGFGSGGFDELLATGIDFVVLAGPLAERLEQVRAATAQSVHCLLTAPIAADLATGEAIVAACDAAEVRLGVLVPGQEDPVLEQVRRMIAADWLGGVVCVQGIAGNDARLHGGGAASLHPLLALTGPQVQLATWLTGRGAVRVTAQTSRTFSPSHDDGAVATATLRGNVLCTFTASELTRVQAFAVHGTDGGVRLAGRNVWLRGKRHFEGHVFRYEHPGEEIVIDRGEIALALEAHADEVEPLGRFARWIDDRDDFPCPGEQALLDLRVLEAMQRAARTGRSEEVG